MNVIETEIKDVLVFEPKVFKDDRGWFMESFNKNIFSEALQSRGYEVPEFVQDNHSMSHKGVIRGMHYQIPPYSQGKLIRVVQGKVWDVVVDIRDGSASFGKWVSVELSRHNQRQLWIPAGFAHGFISLKNNTHLLYKCTNYYNAESQRCLIWNDDSLKIPWPTKNLTDVVVSDYDQNGSTLKNIFH